MCKWDSGRYIERKGGVGGEKRKGMKERKMQWLLLLSGRRDVSSYQIVCCYTALILWEMRDENGRFRIIAQYSQRHGNMFGPVTLSREPVEVGLEWCWKGEGALTLDHDLATAKGAIEKSDAALESWLEQSASMNGAVSFRLQTPRVTLTLWVAALSKDEANSFHHSFLPNEHSRCITSIFQHIEVFLSSQRSAEVI